jgi:hypothetical protein
MDISAHRPPVARALRTLEAAIEGLVGALAHHPIAAVMEPPADRNPARRACEAFSAINYRMEDEVETSVVCLGVIGVSSEILRRAKAVNTAKAEFRAICTPLHRIRIRIPVKGEDTQTRAIAAIRVILRSIQRSDLNLLAAYRKIPILDAPPASVTYTRANTRAVYRKSIEEIDELLKNLEGPTAIADRARLDTLDRRETHLALVKAHYQNIRANVLYTRLDPRGRGRIQIAAELPLLYANGRRAQSPEILFPADPETPKPPRLRQSQLETAPFLRSVSVYRYARQINQ